MTITWLRAVLRYSKGAIRNRTNCKTIHTGCSAQSHLHFILKHVTKFIRVKFDDGNKVPEDEEENDEITRNRRKRWMIKTELLDQIVF